MRDLSETGPVNRLRWWLVRKLVGQNAAVINARLTSLHIADGCAPMTLIDNTFVPK